MPITKKHTALALVAAGAIQAAVYGGYKMRNPPQENMEDEDPGHWVRRQDIWKHPGESKEAYLERQNKIAEELNERWEKHREAHPNAITFMEPYPDINSLRKK